MQPTADQLRRERVTPGESGETAWPLPVVAATLLILVLGGISLNGRSIWLDESITAGLARGSWSSWWTGVAEDGGSQSLYFLAARLTSMLGDDPWVYRLPSLLAAAAVPMPTYRLAARRFGPSVATIAVVILAVSYSFVTNAQEARSYTMLAALITWSWLLLDRAIETPSPARWLRWGIVTALTLYAQPLGLPILMGQAIWMLIERRRLVARSVITGFAAAAVISVPFGYLTLFEAGDHTSWLGTFRLRSFAELVAAAFGAQRVSDALVLSAVGTLLAVGFATVGALSPRPGNDGGQPTSVSGHKRQLPYVLWVVVPIMVLLVGSAFRAFLIARYAVPLVPATATLAAVGIQRLRLVDRRAPLVATAVLVAALLGRTVAGYGNEPVPWDELQAHVSEQAIIDDIVAFEPAYTQAPFEYYTWLRGDETTMARPMAPALGWTPPRHPNLDVYPTTPLAPPSGALWIVVRLDEGRVPDLLARFGIPMRETERTSFGEATVIRFEEAE